MRVALVHDFLNQRGGAERVTLALTRIFEGAPLFTSVFEPGETFEEFSACDINTSFLQRLPHSERTFRALLFLYPAAFKSFDFSDYELVISSSTHWAHRVNAGSAYHVVYCHNPPRWLYQTSEYLTEGGPLPGWARPALAPALAVLRRGDLKAAAKPDLYIANSRLVQSRIARLYGRTASLVNPPIDVDRFSKALALRTVPVNEGHFLVVSRLLPYKRVDLAVEACNAIGAPLIVVGEGPARKEVEKLSGPTIRFVGRVSEKELISLYSGAKALIQCGTEDFGMSLLEANSAGIPCLAYGNGGALETVIDGETGILFPQQMGGSVLEAIERLDGLKWDPSSLQAHARKFDERSFSLELLRTINSSLDSLPSGESGEGSH